ncbi:hypothetical protein [Clostridium sp. BJN0013]|uniref:hypothetical protein n=1 Tax=Clostridium sp. BJN0013 TaxID=3236840 RepID=UPI0034C62386
MDADADIKTVFAKIDYPREMKFFVSLGYVFLKWDIFQVALPLGCDFMAVPTLSCLKK